MPPPPLFVASDLQARPGRTSLFSQEIRDRGEVTVRSLRHFHELSIHYEGEGNRVGVSFDSRRKWLHAFHVVNGYKHTLFRRRVATHEESELILRFSPLWIELAVDGNYAGSSFLESGRPGFIRFDSSAKAAEALERLTIDTLEPAYSSLFIGDGFTGGNWPHVDYWMWPDLLLGGKESFLNAGVSAANSRTAIEVLARVRTHHLRFEKAFLMIGVDDVIDGIPETESQDNYRELLEGLLEISESLYLCTLTPRQDGLNPGIRQFSAFIRALAENFPVKIVPVAEKFDTATGNQCLSFGDFPNRDGQAVIHQAVCECLGEEHQEYPKVRLLPVPSGTRVFRWIGNKFQGLAHRLEAAGG